MNKINGKIIGNPVVTPMPVPDYNQNNPKKADYIKNRPFYVEKVVIEKDLSECTIRKDGVDVFGEIECAELSKIKGPWDNPFPIEVEVDNNGTTEKAKGWYDGNYLASEDGSELWVGYPVTFTGFNGNKIYFYSEEVDSFEGVTVKISFDNIKTIDKKALPQNDVPYIYSEESLFGCVCLPDLASGVYVLHGYFDMTRGDMYTIPYFAEKPILCHVLNVDGNIKLFWFDATENGFIGRYMNIFEGEIVNDEFFEWEGIMGMLDNAYTMANDAISLATDVNDTAIAAYDYAEMISNDTSNMVAFMEGIVIQDEDGENMYKITVDSNGNLKVSPY